MRWKRTPHSRFVIRIHPVLKTLLSVFLSCGTGGRGGRCVCVCVCDRGNGQTAEVPDGMQNGKGLTLIGFGKAHPDTISNAYAHVHTHTHKQIMGVL